MCVLAGRNHNTQMYSGHLGKYETGLGIRVSQDDMPGPIIHAGKMAQESEPVSGKNYGAKAHAGRGQQQQQQQQQQLS
jgi:hypothetical protein